MPPERKSYSILPSNVEDLPKRTVQSFSFNTPQLAEPQLHNLETSKTVLYCACPECGKTFKFKSELDRHLTVHTKDRPYVCSFDGCGKSFKRSDALASHFKSHIKARSFSCTLEGCESVFTTKSALKYHTLRHQSERNFKCLEEGCAKCFITAAQLRQHHKNHHRRGSNTNSVLTEEKRMESDTFEVNDNCSNSISYDEMIDERFIIDELGNFQGSEPLLSSNMRESFTLNDYNDINNLSDINTTLLQLYHNKAGSVDDLTSTGTSDDYLSDKEVKLDKRYSNVLTSILIENDQLKKKLKVQSERFENKYLKKNTEDVDQFFTSTNNFEFCLPNLNLDDNLSRYQSFM